MDGVLESVENPRVPERNAAGRSSPRWWAWVHTETRFTPVGTTPPDLTVVGRPSPRTSVIYTI
ncbi:MAG: hypothetical protein RIS58_796 [Actinomycetota bacterium]